jgi:hypothetical protein
VCVCVCVCVCVFVCVCVCVLCVCVCIYIYICIYVHIYSILHTLNLVPNLLHTHAAVKGDGGQCFALLAQGMFICPYILGTKLVVLMNVYMSLYMCVVN